MAFRSVECFLRAPPTFTSPMTWDVQRYEKRGSRHYWWRSWDTHGALSQSFTRVDKD
jgi:hypothetical protein